jgi:uncharacterized protein (TIGR02996 family)
MNDGDALLAAILADPDDDIPRLVYADWLQENGDEARAEFIRLQCELERCESGSSRHLELRRSAARLLIRHRNQWLMELPRSVRGAHYHFRRGFVQVVEVDADQLVKEEREYRFDALIREVIARNAQSSLSTLCRRPRPTSIRLRARVDHGDSGPPVLMDLLRQAPTSMELFLQQGRWLILCWSVWSGPDRTAAHLLGLLHRRRRLPIQVAIRAFDDHAEFSTWCPVRSRFQSPVWLILENGQLAYEAVGLEPPEGFREGWGED